MIVRMLIVLAALVPVPLAAQTTTKNVQDYLPLAVGNSWTYEHEFFDARDLSGTRIHTTEEITVSILRTEVIDGETYYIFSDVPTTVSEGIPKHFLNGKKLRWDGNNLMEHDGTSSVSLYRFDVATDWNSPIATEYSISPTHGDTLVTGYATIQVTSGLMSQRFFFEGHVPPSGLDFSRGVFFTEGFGVYWTIEVWGDYDLILADNLLSPVRAVFHTAGSQEGITRDASTSSTTTVEWSDFNCYFSGDGVRYNRPCNYPPTSASKSSASWGAVKDRRDNR